MEDAEESAAVADKVDLSGAVKFGVRWWSAAHNNDTGVDVIYGPLDAAHLALAQDTADHDQIEMRGGRGFCSHEVVVLDEDDNPIAVVDTDSGGSDVSSTGATHDTNDELPVVSEDDLPLAEDEGEVTRGELDALNESVWDGNNHMVFTASRAEQYCEEADETVDGRVTWVFETQDNWRALTDLQVDDGWVQLDYYATNGYGNETCSYDIDHDGNKLVEWLEQNGIDAEYSSVNDGASNEQAYACILICEAKWQYAAHRLIAVYRDDNETRWLELPAARRERIMLKWEGAGRGLEREPFGVWHKRICAAVDCICGTWEQEVAAGRANDYYTWTARRKRLWAFAERIRAALRGKSV